MIRILNTKKNIFRIPLLCSEDCLEGHDSLMLLMCQPCCDAALYHHCCSLWLKVLCLHCQVQLFGTASTQQQLLSMPLTLAASNVEHGGWTQVDGCEGRRDAKSGYATPAAGQWLLYVLLLFYMLPPQLVQGAGGTVPSPEGLQQHSSPVVFCQPLVMQQLPPCPLHHYSCCVVCPQLLQATLGLSPPATCSTLATLISAVRSRQEDSCDMLVLDEVDSVGYV